MVASRDRARKLARAKLDRQQARRAAQVRRRRQRQAALGAAVALLLVVLGGVWLTGGFDRDDAEDPAAAEQCAWTGQDAAANSSLKDVGTPPTTGIAESGTRPMTVTTDQGDPITVALDAARAPCAAASFAHLAGRNFYDNTTCHEISAVGAVRCGDPSGTGLGGPTYTFPDENVPTAPDPAPSASAAPAAAAPLYPKGTVAVTGAAAGQNGSQFLIFFKDHNPAAGATAQYSIVGSVTGGMATVDKIGKLPTVDNGSGEKTKPKTAVTIKSLTVGDVSAAPSAAPATAPSASNQS